jgi:surface carbohydrate biosynthesis protein
MKLNKVFTLFKNLKRIKFSISKKQIVIFDGVSFKDLKYIIEVYDYFILEDRLDRINTIYVTPSIIFYFFKYLFLVFRKYSIKVIYTIAIIKSLKSKVVITSIDNSINFFLCAKVLSKEIFFVAIQNGTRYEFEDLKYYIEAQALPIPQNYRKLFYIPNYICFGQNEIDGVTKQNLKIEKFYKFGSIRMSNFFHYMKKKNIKLNKKLFDICFISEPSINANKRFKNKFVEEAAIEILKFTIKFAMENNSKFVFAPKRLGNKETLLSELDFYKPYLNKKEGEFLTSNIIQKENIYSSYLLMFQSSVVIGWQSTLLRDKFGLGEKILSCNFSKLEIKNFPVNGICSLNNHNYENFSARVKLILNLENKDYFKQIEQNPEYVMAFNREESVIEKTRNLIESNFL